MNSQKFSQELSISLFSFLSRKLTLKEINSRYDLKETVLETRDRMKEILVLVSKVEIDFLSCPALIAFKCVKLEVEFSSISKCIAH